MSIQNYEYRGVSVQVLQTDGWHARMRIPGDQFLIPAYPQATREEGIAALKLRVAAAIDAHLADLIG